MKVKRKRQRETERERERERERKEMFNYFLLSSLRAAVFITVSLLTLF